MLFRFPENAGSNPVEATEYRMLTLAVCSTLPGSVKATPQALNLEIPVRAGAW
jgi:hypothetical protein